MHISDFSPFFRTVYVVRGCARGVHVGVRRGASMHTLPGRTAFPSSTCRKIFRKPFLFGYKSKKCRLSHNDQLRTFIKRLCRAFARQSLYNDEPVSIRKAGRPWNHLARNPRAPHSLPVEMAQAAAVAPLRGRRHAPPSKHGYCCTNVPGIHARQYQRTP